MSIVYAPVRFFLDFLRVGPGDKLPADERYFGLTPAQWAAFGLLGLGIYVIRNGKKYEKLVPATYAEARARGARGIAQEIGDPVPDVDDEEGEGDEGGGGDVAPAAPPGRKGKKARRKPAAADAETAADAGAQAPEGEGASEAADDEAARPRRRRRRPGSEAASPPPGDGEPEPV